MSEGWISIHRKIQDHWLWLDKPFSRGQAWIDIIMMVNHADTKIILGNELVEIKRGSRITSIRQLCERWKWSNTKVKNFLKLLEEDNMLVVISDTKKTTLTVVNYNDYQYQGDKESDTKATPERHPSDTKATRKHTNNNDNNDNNDNNTKAIDEVIETFKTKLSLLPQPRKITTKRKEHINARIKEYGLDGVLDVIDIVSESNYLTGRVNDFKADMDWIFNPNNYVKILEGKYKNRETSKQSNVIGLIDYQSPLGEREESW